MHGYIIFWGEKCTLKALIDTGNSLRDFLTDRPVCVVEKKAVEDFVKENTIKGLRTTSFHSVGTEKGEIPVMELEKMCVHKEKECWIFNPVIGICTEHISDDNGYQMLLNPDIF